MVYSSSFPQDTTYVSDIPAAIRSKGEELKNDKIVNAGKLDDKVAGNETGQIPISNGSLNINLNAEMVGGKKAADLVLKDTIRGIGFVMKNPATNEESARIKLKNDRKLIDIDVIADAAPTSAVNIKIYQNTTVIADFSMTLISMTYDINPDLDLSSGDVIYAKINGSPNGIKLINVQLNVKDR